MKKENLHAGHRERMRKRYRENGFKGFQPHEMLEFMLFYCYPQRNTNDIAHKMLKKFGSFSHLLEADVKTIMTVLGCTENVAVYINMFLETARGYTHDKCQAKLILNSSPEARKYVRSLFIGAAVEQFYVLCLDVNFKLINTVLISEGTVNETVVYMQKIANAALSNKAAKIILAHNHPGGTLTPSGPDNNVTQQTKECFSYLRIKLVDHIISAVEKCYSYAERDEFRKKGTPKTVHGYE